MPTVSVIIPALNEAANLPHVLPRIPPDVHEVILVDGYSTDDTVQAARRLLPSVRVIYQQGRGKGAALRTGFAAATGDIIVMLDADGSTDPAEIPAFVGALLAGADFVKGSRFLQGAGTSDMPMHRQVANGMLVMLTNLLFRTRYTDITYGYNALWNTHRGALALEIDNWANEIISNIRVARSGLRDVTYAIGWSAWLDLTPPGVTKASALEVVRERLEVPAGSTLAVGDGGNDLEMLTWAAVGVAMGDDDERVLAVADAWTAGVEDDGVVAVLRSLLS